LCTVIVAQCVSDYYLRSEVEVPLDEQHEPGKFSEVVQNSRMSDSQESVMYTIM